MLNDWKKSWALPALCALGGGGCAAALHLLDGSTGIGVLEGFSGWLRALSLSGPEGNALAWTLVLSLSALPALGLLWRGRQRADWLLLLAGVESFAGLYFLVNHTLLFPAELSGISGLARYWGLMAGGCVLGTMAVWALLRLLGALERAPGRLLPPVLVAASALYGFLAGAAAVLDTLAALEGVAADNTDPARVAFSGAVLWVLAAAELLPSLLGAWVLLWGGELTRSLDAAPFAEGTVALAEAVARRCAMAARVSLLTAAACNLFQMVCAGAAAAVRVSVYLPVGTLALCAALLLLCRYFRRAKAVSDDNESII